MYSAVVLDEESRERLLAAVDDCIPLSHTDIIAHHMTICMGPLPASMEHLLGTKCHLVATHVAVNNKVVAVAVVTGVQTKNKFPHVTVAVNREAGGKPKDSNDFFNRDWIRIDPVRLVGTVQEVS